METLVSSQLVVIGLAAMLSQWLAWKLRLPAIMFLLGFGFVLGPLTGYLDPQELLGRAFHPFISAAVAIILFEGSLQLQFSKIREARAAIASVILIGAPLGWLLISYGAHHIAGLSWPVAVTLGGMLVVTGPTVVMPMLRHARLNHRVSAILKWEGIINDAIGVLLAVLSYEYFATTAGGEPATAFFATRGLILVAVAGGSFALAKLFTFLFERGHVPEYLKAPFLLVAVLGIFFCANLLLPEAGLVAVVILGMILTNVHRSTLEEVKRFKETVTLLLVSGVFLLLTADLDLSVLLEMNWRGLLFVVALLCLLRPVTMLVCSLGTRTTWREALLIGWLAPRGIVCAAMAGVIGPRLVEAGFADGNKVLPLAFTIVVVSVVLDSLTVDWVARRLRLNSPPGNGLVIAGAHDWSVQLAEQLAGRKLSVLLADEDFSALRAARLAGLPVYHGELLSDAAETEVDFQQYDMLLAATPSAAYNAFLFESYGRELGRNRVFHLNVEHSQRSGRRMLAHSRVGPSWGPERLGFEAAAMLFAEGWRFRLVRVGQREDGALLMPEEAGTRMLLGFVAEGGRLELYSSDHLLKRAVPKPGDLLLVFELKGETEAQA